MFFEDALTHQKWKFTLTRKSCGQEERAPCAAFYHAVDGYLNKLVSKGYKVAICETVESQRSAKRHCEFGEVIRVVTPGDEPEYTRRWMIPRIIICSASPTFPEKWSVGGGRDPPGTIIYRSGDIRRLQDEITQIRAFGGHLQRAVFRQADTTWKI